MKGLVVEVAVVAVVVAQEGIAAGKRRKAIRQQAARCEEKRRRAQNGQQLFVRHKANSHALVGLRECNGVAQQTYFELLVWGQDESTDKGILLC